MGVQVLALQPYTAQLTVLVPPHVTQAWNVGFLWAEGTEDLGLCFGPVSLKAQSGD